MEQRVWINGIAPVFLAVFFLLPISFTIGNNVITQIPGLLLTLDDYIPVAIRSINLAIVVSGICMLLGTLLAILSAGFTPRIRLIITLVLCIPIFIPSYIHALSWSRLFAPNSILSELFSSNDGPLLGSSAAAIWVLIQSYYPIAYILMLMALNRWSIRWKEAASMFGTPWASFYKIRLPYLVPPAIVSFAITSLLVLSNFAVPDLFQINVYATEIFIRVGAFMDMAGALKLSIFPLCIAVIFASVFWLLRKRISFQVLAISKFEERETDIPLVLRSIVLIAVGLLFIALPMLQLILLLDISSSLSNNLLDSATDLFNTMLRTFASVTISCLICISLSHWLHQKRYKGSGFIRLGVWLLLAFPISLLGLGVLELVSSLHLNTYFWFMEIVLITSLSIKALPFVFEISQIGMKKIANSQYSASLLSGMSPMEYLWHIAIPQTKQYWIAAGLVAAVISISDLALTVLLSPPGASSLTLRIFSFVHYGPDSLVAAMCLLQIIFIACLGGVTFLLLSRSKNRGGLC